MLEEAAKAPASCPASTGHWVGILTPPVEGESLPLEQFGQLPVSQHGPTCKTQVWQTRAEGLGLIRRSHTVG